MNIQYSFINYAEVIAECQERKITEDRGRERCLAEKIINSPLDSISVLDFIGAEHMLKNPKHYQRLLIYSLSAYKKKCGKNLPIILFNIDKQRLDNIKKAKGLLNWLNKNGCLIPVISEYGELISILGPSEYDQKNIKLLLQTYENDFFPESKLDTIVDKEFFEKDSWLWEKDNLTYRAIFSLKDLINTVATDIIKQKLGAIQKGHFQLLSGKHTMDYISPSALYAKPYYNSWMARIIYSKFRKKQIDVIATYSSQTLILSLEVKAKLEKRGAIIECVEMEDYNKPTIKHSPPYYKKFKDRKVLIIVDVMSTGKLSTSMADSIIADGGKIQGVVSIVSENNYEGRYQNIFFSLCKYHINLYDRESCPGCKEPNELPFYYISPITNSPTKCSAKPEDYHAIFDGNEENVWFWDMVMQTGALKTHILFGEEKKHYYYYIDTFAILNKYIDKIDWGLKCWYGEDPPPDFILSPKNPSALKIANFIVNNEFPGAKLLAAEKKGDIFSCGDEKRLAGKNILIIDDGANTCRTLNGLLHICKRNNSRIKNVKICMFVNRLIGDYRHMLEGQIPEKNIRSICRIPIPPFTDDVGKCPLCTEIDQLKKHYSLMSPDAKKYIDNRLAKINATEYTNATHSHKKKTPERSILRIKALDFLYGKGSTAFLDALRHKTPLSKLWLVLETIPQEYIGMSDIKDWLSKQIPETTDKRHLTKLVQMWLSFDPYVLIKHLDHVTMQFAIANKKNFLSFIFEFLICEQIISRNKMKSHLIESMKRMPKFKAFFKSIINSAIDKYPEEILFRPSLQKIYKKIIVKAATSDANLLIEGKTGTGKNVLAKIIHQISNRNTKPFIHINIAALAENLIESELFGHEKGAFTGAIRQKRGKLELADGGTLILDEISNIPLNLQVKLLRVLEAKKFERVGGTEEIKSDFRLICATNETLETLVKEKKFRADLYYRINVVQIPISPLRDNPSEIDTLAIHFLDKYAKKEGGNEIVYTNQMKQLLKSHQWKGNIRELEHVINRAVIFSNNGKIDLELLKDSLNNDMTTENFINEGTFKKQVNNKKRSIIIDALKKYEGDKTKTAESLGISRQHIYKLIKESKIKMSDYLTP